jgi:integrase
MPKKRQHGDGALYPIRAHGCTRTGAGWSCGRKPAQCPKGRIVKYKGVVDLEPIGGVRKQRAVTAKTQAATRAKLDALKKEIAENGAPLDKQTTLADWAWRWIAEECRPNLKPNSLSSYETMTRTWIVPTLGHRKVATLKPSDVRSLMKHMTDSGRSSSTARKVYNILSGMLEAARREGMTGRNVTQDITPPAMAIPNTRALTNDEAFAVLRTSTKNANGSMWWMAILAGLRQSERIGAQIADLDLKERAYTVRWTLDEVTSEHGCGQRDAGGWPCGKKQGAACPDGRLRIPHGMPYKQLIGRLCLVPPKSGRPRRVPLVAPLAEALEWYLESTAEVPNPYGLIWRKPDGSPILPGEDEQAWLEILRAAGVITADQAQAPRFRPEGTPKPPGSHTARHTTLTVLMELGVHPKVIGEIVGHMDARTSAGYQHLSAEHALEVMDLVGAKFAGALAGGWSRDAASS